MLIARRIGFWGGTYRIDQNGEHVARWNRSWWRSRGTFDLGAQRYAVRANAWGTRYTLQTPTGQPLATADRVGRKRWTVTAGGHTYHFRRASIWRSDQELLQDDRVTGAIRATGVWRSSVTADLPGLPLPIQVFVLCVVLTQRAAESSSAA